MTKQVKLSDFDVSETTGFVATKPPLRKLPGEYFSSWEDTCTKIPALIENKELRAKIDALPERQFNKETLESEEEWKRAYVLLTFLSQSYIWAEGEAGVIDTLPKKLAVPWYAVSEHLAMKPVATYASVILYNYSLRDPKGGMTADNLVAVSTFTGTKDESWFYMVHVLVELAAVSGLKAIEGAFEAMKMQKNEKLKNELQKIEKAIDNMRKTLQNMYNKCDAEVYYCKVRHFLSGAQGNPAFPNGVIYEGVDNKPHFYNGGSAAQSSSIPSFDALLGAKHPGPEKDPTFMRKMREYQPRKHRDFLVAIDTQPSLREYIKKSQNSELIKKYNSALESLIKFRRSHMRLIDIYIIEQSRKCRATEATGTHGTSVDPGKDETAVGIPVKALAFTGAGGTPVETFLKQVKDSTESIKIPLPVF
ncbi:indoleamine 2,3-dioxygenase 2-like [Halichondria panicea]|uniref:indoleamine 2,3-dioxygenase 2-like n=1 Tax=Halichondria panicea TaxID=6063 RepID=UPI00312B9904